TSIVNKISQNIKNKYKSKEISEDEFKNLLYSLISKKDIDNLSIQEKKIAFIYDKMNKGYKYETKVIKDKDVTPTEKDIIRKEINELSIGFKYSRDYLVNDTLRYYFGNIGSIRKEDENKYLSLGYKRSDRVGVSFLEKQYEEYLRGRDESYSVSTTGVKKIISNPIKGKDIYLSIDINLQKDIDNIIFNEVKKTKKEKGTKYYDRSYAIVGNPNTGEIYAFSSEGILGETKRVNYGSDLITVSLTPGSIVKAASHMVGYNTSSIKYGDSVVDGCIKVKNTKEKCSWKSLGRVDDLTALKYSSNYYQFLIAINVGKGNYYYNGPLVLDKAAFSIYREMYNSFGLGVKTGIDLPFEAIGYKGNDLSMGSILDFPIGQYDTYTPLQIFQYVNTIYSNGRRIAPHFLKSIDSSGKYKYEEKELGKVNTTEENFLRVKKGLKMVMQSGGTGNNYINKLYDPYGKTGTSQSFIDTDNDGKIDTSTISNSFVAYAQSNESIASFVVISPNVSDGKSSYVSSVNKRLTREISDLYFNKYNIYNK
ncbi:MAG: penicillin-binding transpeptidase domain-containing protein, partial [Bacilli bacterium]